MTTTSNPSADDLRRLGITRARVDRATACHYRDTGRVIVIADKGDFEAAQAALEQLRAAVTPSRDH